MTPLLKNMGTCHLFYHMRGNQNKWSTKFPDHLMNQSFIIAKTLSLKPEKKIVRGLDMRQNRASILVDFEGV
jgi:hypothetical protein